MKKINIDIKLSEVSDVVNRMEQYEKDIELLMQMYLDLYSSADSASVKKFYNDNIDTFYSIVTKYGYDIVDNKLFYTLK